jgi:hypothetical protein
MFEIDLPGEQALVAIEADETNPAGDGTEDGLPELTREAGEEGGANSNGDKVAG